MCCASDRAIGQRASAVAKVIAKLQPERRPGIQHRGRAEGNDAPGLNYVTPYAATSIAEYFMEVGRDVLIVYDDLTQHARSYRELSLLLRRPPGREAFPGDIFYIHSRLLEALDAPLSVSGVVGRSRRCRSSKPKRRTCRDIYPPT